MKKNIKKRTHHNPHDYVNQHTGEEFEKGTEMFTEEETELMHIKHKEFFQVSSVGWKYLLSQLTDNEIVKFLTTTSCLKSEFNICFNSNRPHTTESLCKLLGINNDNLTRFIKQMQKKGLITYAISVKSGYEGKVYMVNPYISAKRNTFHRDLDIFFNDVTKTVDKQRNNG